MVNTIVDKAKATLSAPGKSLESALDEQKKKIDAAFTEDIDIARAKQFGPEVGSHKGQADKSVKQPEDGKEIPYSVGKEILKDLNPIHEIKHVVNDFKKIQALKEQAAATERVHKEVIR